MRKEITDHQKTLDPNNPRDLMDIFLLEKETTRNPEFSEEMLAIICLDLFAAGAETTSTTLMWLLLYITKNQVGTCDA